MVGKLESKDQQLNKMIQDKGKIDMDRQSKHHSIQEQNTLLEQKQETISTLSQQNIQFKEKNDLLKQENGIIRQKLKGKMEEVKIITKDITDWTFKNQSLASSVELINQQFESLKHEQIIYKQQIAAKEEQLKQLNKTKVEHEVNIRTLSKQKIELKENMTGFKTELKKLIAFAEAKEKVEKGLNRENERLTKESEFDKAQIKQLEKDVDKLK